MNNAALLYKRNKTLQEVVLLGNNELLLGSMDCNTQPYH